MSLGNLLVVVDDGVRGLCRPLSYAIIVARDMCLCIVGGNEHGDATALPPPCSTYSMVSQGNSIQMRARKAPKKTDHAR